MQRAGELGRMRNVVFCKTLSMREDKAGDEQSMAKGKRKRNKSKREDDWSDPKREAGPGARPVAAKGKGKGL